MKRLNSRLELKESLEDDSKGQDFVESKERDTTRSGFMSKGLIEVSNWNELEIKCDTESCYICGESLGLCRNSLNTTMGFTGIPLRDVLGKG